MRRSGGFNLSTEISTLRFGSGNSLAEVAPELLFPGCLWPGSAVMRPPRRKAQPVLARPAGPDTPGPTISRAFAPSAPPTAGVA